MADSSAAKDHSYDAIVIGTGITGGWAAKERTRRA
jgi:choline dehydrogenase-like flavoprotein